MITNFDIFINVIKRPEAIVYRSRVGPASANVGYVGSLALSSDANITIDDTSGSLAPNRVLEDVRIYNNVATFSCPTDNFLLTDKFTVETPSSPSIPLFHKHELGHFQVDDQIASYTIYDDLFTEVLTTQKELDETNGVLYHNLESKYDIIPDQKNDPQGIEYSYYYISYTIVNSSGTKNYRELLSNALVFRPAVWEDFDSSTLLLDLDSEAYLIEPTPSSFLVNIASPRKLAVDSMQDAKLKLLWPTSKDYTDPWYLRVSNGRFYYQDNFYRITEEQYNMQSFNPQIGTKRVQKESPTVLSKNIIKTDYENLNNNPDLQLYIHLKITQTQQNSDGTVSSSNHHFTTEPGYSGLPTYVEWTLETEYGIKSIDYKTGFIEVDGVTLSKNDSIEVNYYYDEKYYEFTEIDFNPIRNEEILNRRVVLYIDPDAGLSLKHAVFELDGDEISGGYETINKLEQETTTGAFDAEAEYRTGNLFALGYVTVGEGSGVSDLTILDTRIYGGGVKSSHEEEVQDLYPEYSSFFDKGAWDGRPFPGSLNYLIKVPIDNTFKEHNGLVDVRNLKTILNKHTALGVYPIVKAYGPEVKLISIDLERVDGTTANAIVTWKAVDNCNYLLYYKEKNATAWTLGSTYTHPVSPENRVVSISKTISLPSNKEYSFVVVGNIKVDGSDKEAFTQHISDTSTAIKTITDNPDSLNVMKILIPSL